MPFKTEQHIALAGAYLHTIAGFCAREGGLCIGQTKLKANINNLFCSVYGEGNRYAACITGNGQVAILLSIIASQQPKLSAVFVLQVGIAVINFRGKYCIKVAGKAEGGRIRIPRLIRCTGQRIQNLYRTGIQLQVINAYAKILGRTKDGNLTVGNGLGQRHAANLVALPVANCSDHVGIVQHDHDFKPLICRQLAQALTTYANRLVADLSKMHLLVTFFTVRESYSAKGGFCILELHTPLHNVSAVVYFIIQIQYGLYWLMGVDLQIMVAVTLITADQRAFGFIPLVGHHVAISIGDRGFACYISALVPILKVCIVIPLVSRIQLGNGRFGNNQLRILVGFIRRLNNRQTATGINLQIVKAKHTRVFSGHKGNRFGGNGF